MGPAVRPWSPRGVAQHAGFAACGPPGGAHHPQGGGVTASRRTGEITSHAATSRPLSRQPSQPVPPPLARCKRAQEVQRRSHRRPCASRVMPARRQQSSHARAPRWSTCISGSTVDQRSQRVRCRPRQCAKRGFSCSAAVAPRPQPDSALVVAVLAVLVFTSTNSQHGTYGLYRLVPS